ncbi:hypothetical protein NKH77_52600 [Streptomyces sp. M19]
MALHDPPPMRHADPVLASLITALLARSPKTVRAWTAPWPCSAPAHPRSRRRYPGPAHTRRAGRTTRTHSVGGRARDQHRAYRASGHGELVPAGRDGPDRVRLLHVQHRGGWAGAYSISVGTAAVVAVFFGLAAMFYRWNRPGKPPLRVVGALFFPVFLPLATIWAVWNTVLLA